MIVAGIGAGLARAFHSRGAQVIIGGRDLARLQAYLRTVGLIQSTDLKEVSGSELVFDVTNGVPHASASKTGSPKPSNREGNTAHAAPR